MIIYAVFCATSIGNCVCVLPAYDDQDAKKKALEWLVGKDIEEVDVTKIERVAPDKEVCVFWDNELE